MYNLYKRHLLNLIDYNESEIRLLIACAQEVKKAKRTHCEKPLLNGKIIVLVFEEKSTRTRAAFEVAAYAQGAHATYIDLQSSQMVYKESIEDTARVLGTMFDAIVYRGFHQEVVQTLASYAGVPVINALTDTFHPTQMLADILTMQEHSDKSLQNISYAYLGDGRNNIARSLLLVGAKLGMDVRIASPQSLHADDAFIQQCKNYAQHSGARVLVTSDIAHAVEHVDFLYTDVWVSLGESSRVWAERIQLLFPYQVNMKLLKETHNPHVKCMHCLPAFHNNKTRIGEKIIKEYPHLSGGMEITEEVFESKYTIAFEQAENRLHTIKALLVSILSEPPYEICKAQKLEVL